MAHSVELLLDEATDLQIRRQWDLLRNAGLPSQATIDSATNRPHVTLVAAQRIDPGVDAALATVALRLPFTAVVGAPIVFGQGRTRTLARLVVPSTELLATHAQMVRLAAGHVADTDGTPSLLPHCRPGHWTPHVTLARRIATERIGEAIAALGNLPALNGRFAALRRWDSDTRTDHLLAGREC